MHPLLLFVNRENELQISSAVDAGGVGDAEFVAGAGGGGDVAGSRFMALSGFSMVTPTMP